MTAKTISYYLACGLLALGGVLAAWNWYLRPERAMASIATLVVLGAMAFGLVRSSRRSMTDAAWHQADSAIRSAVVFAALILAVSLGGKIAASLGAIDDDELLRRAIMVVFGGFFVFTGNTMPKTLTPLSATRCDPARTQAFQRFAGWTWVLTGLVYALVWMAAPISQVEALSLAVLMVGMLTVLAQAVRLQLTRKREA